ncbi:MAG: UvrD-helicase domain-containing protein, partial [Rhodospirillales bacterium]|nr:UvrD-helicase domain-containing protein [Rhodospirillales bacterium]
MEPSPRASANEDQRAAADPAVSAFVAASAGSGKTKLLTDRLLRLMLAGADPARILCLTFTKAAAAEMALRLQRRLGEWAAAPDETLDAALAALDVAPTAAVRARARALFATILDLPGGMRIGTIHAFCQSLLRRFPLEAGISPHFRLIEGQDAIAARAEAREDLLRGPLDPARKEALRRVAALASAERFSELVGDLFAERERLDAALADGLDALLAAQRRALGLPPVPEADPIAAAIAWPEQARLAAALADIAARGSPAVAEKAGRMAGWLGCAAADRAAHWDEWCAEFFRKDGGSLADSGFVNKKLADAAPDLLAACLAERDRVAAIEDRRRAEAAAEASSALFRLLAPLAGAYASRKEIAGELDYPDLIGRARTLLDPRAAAWVLYKLDGGLDHLLLDEVQDTAPAQWEIAERITAECFAGAGARAPEAEGAPPRSAFAVGDRKQSIFSFQGADAEGFDAGRARLAERARAGGARWIERTLNVSFRATAPVLALVDAVFADPLAAAGVAPPATLRHRADRAGAAGVVELWPLAPAPDKDDPPPWSVAGGYETRPSSAEILADTLARWIAAQIGGMELASRGRHLRAGDVMILLRRRNAFAGALLRALKSAGVPTGGLDRMVLTEQPAVADLLTFCDALLLPEDDLAFACYLTSPLGGLTDDGLMALAMDRAGGLAEALRDRAGERPDWSRAWEDFAALRARVDHASPYAVLAEALGPRGFRARLFARLGAEAGEPVDELLAAALAHAGAHPPSLQSFLHWIRRAGAEAKREQEEAGDSARILTVHGAKGLQAPLVILPDTTGLPPPGHGLFWAPDPPGPEVPVWLPRKELRSTASDGARAAAERLRTEEYHRLLYVALTRAEDRLLVCGHAPVKALDPGCWYELVGRGFDRLGAEAVPFGPPLAPWNGTARRLASAQTDLPRPEQSRPEAAARAAPPSWFGAAPAWRAAPPP